MGIKQRIRKWLCRVLCQWKYRLWIFDGLRKEHVTGLPFYPIQQGITLTANPKWKCLNLLNDARKKKLFDLLNLKLFQYQQKYTGNSKETNDINQNWPTFINLFYKSRSFLIILFININKLERKENPLFLI